MWIEVRRVENMFLTTKEIALKWGVSATWVTVLCKKGRIEGVIRKGNRWYIPEDAMIGDLVKAHRLKPDLDLSTCLLELVVFIKL